MNSSRWFVRIVFLIVFAACMCLISAGCARPPYVAPAPQPFDYGQFVLRLPSPEVELDALRGKRIVIDPGHGGSFAGAVGPNNLREADVNLGVALQLWGMLTQAGAEAYLTRTDDSNVYKGDNLTLKKDLHARAEFAGAQNADLFLSLHHNADVLPGAKKNSLETYFKMGDPGPSLDAARCIHRQLALSLGEKDNVILPGNFHVLRENPTTAILGEPSYISHPANAFRLGLAPMQRVEAQAYFFGIAEYFSKGVPRIVDMSPEGTVIDTSRPFLTARVEPDRDVPTDPSSILMLIDDEPVDARFDAKTARITYLPRKRLSNGTHVAQVFLRNTNGNAARPQQWEFAVSMAPAYLVLEPGFTSARPGSAAPIRISARVFDTDLVPVADGTSVEFHATSGMLSPATSSTIAGEATTYFTPLRDSSPQEVTVSATASGLTHSVTLTLTDDAPEFVAANVFDAKTGAPLEGALAMADGEPIDYTDRAGYFAVDFAGIGATPVTFSRKGYIAQTASLSKSSGATHVKLEPVANGVLFGQKIALDPQFGGHEKGAIGPTGVRASDLNMLVAQYLTRLLEDSGASVVLTRTSDETATALQRVETAEAFGAQWFISIGHGKETEYQTLEPEGTATNLAAPCANVLYYPTSEEGKRLAQAVANTMRSLGIAETVFLEPNNDFVLTHTSSPAIRVICPSPSVAEVEEKLRNPNAARKEAHAIYLGILANFGFKEGVPAGIDVGQPKKSSG